MRKVFLMALALILSHNIAMAFCDFEAEDYEDLVKMCNGDGKGYVDIAGEKIGPYDREKACGYVNMALNLWQACLIKNNQY